MMIIACPACATRYAVPDNAIGAQGRTVRCAKCRHSWFQDGTSYAEPPPAVAPPPPVAEPAPPRSAPPPAAVASTPPADSPPQDAPVLDAPAQDPAAQDTPAQAQVATPNPSSFLDKIEHGGFDAAPSSFAHEPPFRPRRNPARLWTMLAATFAVLALMAAAAVWRLGLPAWLPFGHSPFAAGQPDLVLSFPPNRQDRRSLANGGEYFGISGTITNVGKQRRNVPQLEVILRDDHERKVYSWEITPAKRVLAPGEAVAVSEAMTDIPHSARSADIGWKAP
jgi:predicted Zn finger-like uncharacterized protein